jgi:hypothetical protein
MWPRQSSLERQRTLHLQCLPPLQLRIDHRSKPLRLLRPLRTVEQLRLIALQPGRRKLLQSALHFWWPWHVQSHGSEHGHCG